MKQVQTVVLVVLGFGAAFAASGCNLGDAPAGPSQAEYQKSLDQMTPDQKIKFVESSPLPPSQKEKEIAAIKTKAGIK